MKWDRGWAQNRPTGGDFRRHFLPAGKPPPPLGLLNSGCRASSYPMIRHRIWGTIRIRPYATSSTPPSEYSSQSRGGLPRFFSPVLPSAKGGVVRVQGDEFFHITRVLRLSADDRVELFNGKGGLVSGIIRDVDRAGLEFAALEDPRLIDPPRPQWHVYAAFGTLKGGRADWLVEKCTELGASSVTPLLTERSPSISNNRVERLERVILAATKQCQRLHEMRIHPPLDIRDLADQVRQSQLSFLAVAEAPPLLNVLTSQRNEPEGSIIVGPEGDFTEKESNVLMEAGAASVGLGPHRLRVETATIALLATLMLWSDRDNQLVV